MLLVLRPRVGLLAIALFAASLASGANLVLQESFAPRFEQNGAEVGAALLAPDGKFYIAGDFAVVDGTTRTRLARFNADGSLDTTYAPTTIQDGNVVALALDSAGRLLIGGDFTLVDGASREGLARLTTTGALDTTFTIGTGFLGTVEGIAVDSQDRVVAVGNFVEFNGAEHPYVVRLTSSGAVDATFHSPFAMFTYNSAYAVAVQGNDKILFGAYAFGSVVKLHRLNLDGALDATFNPGGAGPNGTVHAILVQPVDGRIIVAGDFNSYNGTSSGRIVRLETDGTREAAFAPNVSNGTVYALALGPGDKIVLAGDFSAVGGGFRRHVARLNSDGSLDAAFDTGTGSGLTGYGYFSFSNAETVIAFADGTVVAGGDFTAVDDTPRTAVARYTNAGALDATWAPVVRRAGIVRVVRPAAGGQWLVGGDFDFVNGTARGALARLNADGTLDANFAPPSGNGFSDPTYLYNRSVQTIAVQGDGRILVGGVFQLYDGAAHKNVVRLESTGAVDATFDVGNGPVGGVSAIHVQGDGAILLGGDFYQFNGESRFGLVRVSTLGVMDATFNTGEGPASGVRALLPMTSGSVLVAGQFTTYNAVEANQLVALTSTGAIDPAFSSGSGITSASFNDNLLSAAGSGNRYYAAGRFTTFAGASVGNIAALTGTGALAPGFVSGPGFDSDVTTIFARSNGTVVAGGPFANYNGTARAYVALLGTDGAVDTSLDLGTVRAIHPGFFTGGNYNVHAFGEGADGSLLVGGTWLQLGEFTGRGLILLSAPAGGTPPTIVAPPANANAVAGASAAFTVDAAGTGTLTYQWQRQPAAGGGFANVTDGAPYSGATTATLTINPTTYAMNGDQFQCVVSNGNAPDPTSTTATLTVRIPPVITPVDDVAVNEGSALAFTVAASDPGTPSQALTYALSGTAPAGAAINPTTGAFSWTPTEAQGPGSYPITVVVTKTDTTSAQEAFTVTVNEVNLAPVLTFIGSPRHINLGGPLALTATASDADLPVQALTFSLDAGAPAWATINPTTGAFSAAPGPGIADGSYDVTVRVTDNATSPLADSETISLIVDRTAPRISAMTPTGVTDAPVDRITLTFTDAIAFGTFAAGDVSVIGPGGAVSVLGVDQIDTVTARVRFVSSAATGSYTVTVAPTLADVAGNALDQDNDGTPGEATQDQFSASFSLLAPPDLVIENVTVTGTGVPGSTATAAWILRNTGDSALPSSGYTGVALSYDGSTTNLYQLVDDTFAGTIAAGAVLPRSKQFVVPNDGPTGNVFVVVTANRDRALTEASYANNAALSATALTIPARLTLALSPSQVREDDANPAATGTVSRNGSTTAALTVTLVSSDTTEATVPASVVIPAGQTAATFAINVVADSNVDGTQTAQISATASGFATANVSLDVFDVNQPALTLAIADPVLLEGDVRTVTLSRGGATTAALTVSLRASTSGDVTVPSSATIPADSASVIVTITATPDSALELDRDVTLTAEVDGYASGTLLVTVIDDDTPMLTFTLSDDVVSEAAGANALFGTVTRQPVLASALTVTLSNSDATVVTMPTQVTIPSGQFSASFTITPVDNGAIDGDRSVNLGASVVLIGVPLSTAIAQTLTILDDDGPRLALDIPAEVVGEGVNPAATATVSRPQATVNALVVTIASSDAATATAPATVTIPANATSTTFDLATPAHAGSDGARTVIFTATAAGLNASQDSVIVTDEAKPELAIAALGAPAVGATDAFVTVTFRVENRGLAAATPPPSRPWTDRVFLSATGTLADAILAGEVTFGDSLAVGASYERTVPVRLPHVVGSYFVLVQTNFDVRVDEVTRANNLRVSDDAIDVTAAYTATVAADVTTGPTGQPITFTGHASLSAGGAPAVSAVLNLHLGVRGTNRIFTVVTNVNGDFSYAWTPLAGEGGHYTVGAVHPGVSSATVQDTFDLLGITASPRPLLVDLSEASALVGTFTITNLADVTLTNCSFAAVNPPAGVTINATLPSPTLAALATVSVNYTVNAAPGSAGTGQFDLRFTSAEGAIYNLPVDYEVIGPAPVLAADVTEITASMLVGAQRVVPVTITNVGGAATGPIALYLPNVAWMSAGAALPLPSLAAGESTTFDLVLTPVANLPLDQYTGTIGLLGTVPGAELVLPFSIRSVADGAGTLVVNVTDEFTFYSAAAPQVAGATVTLRDPFDGSEIAVGTSDANGVATFAALPAGGYQVETRAPKHTAARTTVFVDPGATKTLSVFIQYEAVSVSWTVEPAEIQDVYTVTVNSIFETNVPKPVIVVSPGVIEVGDLVYPGQAKQVDLTFTNHGLIAANDLQVTLPTAPGYEFIALATQFGALGANRSVTLPVLVRRVAPAGPTRRGGEPAMAAAGGGCSNGGFSANYFCAGANVGLLGSFGSSGSSCSTIGGGGGGGGGGNGGGGGGGSQSDPPCDECLTELLQELTKCILGMAWSSVSTVLPPAVAGCVGSTAAGCAVEFSVTGSSQNSVIGCLLGGAKGCIPGIGPVFGYLDCACGIMYACDKAPTFSTNPYCGLGNSLNNGLTYLEDLWNDPLPVSSGTNSLPGARDRAMAAAVDPDEALTEVQASYRRLLHVLTLYFYILGDKAWMNSSQPAMVTDILDVIEVVGDDASDQGRTISPTEADLLRAAPRPTDVPLAAVDYFITRWNRSVSYWAQGIIDHDQVPEGMDPDFIAQDYVRKFALLQVAELAAAEERNPGQIPLYTLIEEHAAAMQGTANQLAAGGGSASALRQRAQSRPMAAAARPLADPPAGGTCATVKLKLDQGIVMTRSGFKASLELANGLADTAITDVRIDVLISDANGLPANDRFGLRAPTLAGLTAVDGSGIVAASTTGSATWIIVPNDTAAPLGETRYFVGGLLHYVQGDQTLDIALTPVAIDVRPDAALALKYFHQRDVFSDDPHTAVIESSEPYTLAVMMQNNGAGAARDLTITSAQPAIADNEKGLAIAFAIVGGEVFEGAAGNLASRDIPPSLTVDFGAIQPDETKIARWLLTSPIQGLFTDYSATFEHIDSLGDPRLSLIKSVAIHELVRAIDDAAGAPAFLVNDLPDGNHRPDTLHLADGSTAPISVVENATNDGAPASGDLVVQLMATLPAGWSYLRVADPANGAFRLVRVQRQNGSDLAFGRNAWITDRTFLGFGLQPIRENVLHLADFNSTGTYTLTYAALAPADTTAPVSSVTTLPATSMSPFTVTWSGTDATGIANFDIFVSENGGAATLWQSATIATGALFSGVVGNTYAFHSRARDAAGNYEGAPASADATTTVNATNVAPVLAAIADQTINESTTLALQLAATDANPGTVLTWELGTNSPPGVVLDPATGELSWPTSGDQGGASYPITVIVRDNGTPRLSDTETFDVIVSEVNNAPVLDLLAAQNISAGRTLSVQATASDQDLPAQTLTFSLGGIGLPGLAINSATGVITWTPTPAQVGAVQVVQVQVTDSGTPTRSDTTELAIAVAANPDLAKETWTSDNFTAPEIANDTISGDTADPNGNTRTNLMEYALGAPPVEAFDPTLYLRTIVVLDAGDGRHHARLVYRQRKDDPRLVFYPEVSGDRANWANGAGAIQEISRTSIDAEFDEVVMQDRTAAAPGAPRYFRLRVVRN